MIGLSNMVDDASAFQLVAIDAGTGHLRQVTDSLDRSSSHTV